MALMAWWKKLLCSLVVLDLRGTYHFPKESGENRACPGCVGSSLEVECVREGAVRWCGGCGALVVARLNPLPHASGVVAIEVVLDALADNRAWPSCSLFHVTVSLSGLLDLKAVS